MPDVGGFAGTAAGSSRDGCLYSTSVRRLGEDNFFRRSNTERAYRLARLAPDRPADGNPDPERDRKERPPCEQDLRIPSDRRVRRNTPRHAPTANGRGVLDLPGA